MKEGDMERISIGQTKLRDEKSDSAFLKVVKRTTLPDDVSLDVLRPSQTQGGDELLHIVLRSRQGKEESVHGLLVSKYHLVSFAHQILREFDPSNLADSASEKRSENS